MSLRVHYLRYASWVSVGVPGSPLAGRHTLGSVAHALASVRHMPLCVLHTHTSAVAEQEPQLLILLPRV